MSLEKNNGIFVKILTEIIVRRESPHATDFGRYGNVVIFVTAKRTVGAWILYWLYN